MQDRFVADIGDFGKYGLLRGLTLGLAGCVESKPAGYGDGQRQLRLGVIWNWQPNNRAPGDPQAAAMYNYIADPSETEERLRECDDELFGILANLVTPDDGRSVAAIQTTVALPPGTVFFLDDVSDRTIGRSQWFQNAMDAVQGCDIAFLDPDNGLKSNGGNPDLVANEHAFFEEAAQLWKRGQSPVIYQDVSRRNLRGLVQQQFGTLRNLLPGAEPIALWYRRHGPRAFYVIPRPEIRESIERRVAAFLECGWGTGNNPHFTRVDF